MSVRPLLSSVTLDPLAFPRPLLLGVISPYTLCTGWAELEKAIPSVFARLKKNLKPGNTVLFPGPLALLRSQEPTWFESEEKSENFPLSPLLWDCGKTYRAETTGILATGGWQREEPGPLVRPQAFGMLGPATSSL